MSAQVCATALDTTMGKQARQERSHSSLSRRKHKSSSDRPNTHTKAVNPIKSKIRDLTRLLEHSDHLPADVRIEKERALAGYKQDLEIALKDKRRSHMISKYHMVRFFERQKATRNLKRLQTRLAAASPINDQAGLQQAIHEAEVDLNYTISYPLNVKYLSLYPRTNGKDSTVRFKSFHADDTLSPQAATQRSSMWSIVEQCMQEGSLDILRDGKLSLRYAEDENNVGDKIEATKERMYRKNRTDNAKAAKAVERPSADGNDSDEGFFET